jgi:hypothetical protein
VAIHHVHVNDGAAAALGRSYTFGEAREIRRQYRWQ